MINLLKNELPLHYGLHRSTINVPSETTNEEYFDLLDGGRNFVVEYKSGNVSFEHNNKTEIEIINYEAYIGGFSSSKFERGRKRCDFILYEAGGSADSFIVLNEQTSAIGSTENLDKPILGKNKAVIFPGGKYEKVEVQLLKTLETLMNVSTISLFLSKYKRKICLMSYVINNPQKMAGRNAQQSFSGRYRMLESRVTGDNGAELEHLEINARGFEYRRISHDYLFKLS